MKGISNEKTMKQYNEGLEYIYPQNQYEWRDQIEYRMKEDGNCDIVDLALRYMKSLDKGEKVWAEYKRSDGYKLSDEDFSKVLKLITKFSKRGVDFYYWVVEHRYARLICGKEEKMLLRIASQNMKFKKEVDAEAERFDA